MSIINIYHLPKTAPHTHTPNKQIHTHHKCIHTYKHTLHAMLASGCLFYCSLGLDSSPVFSALLRGLGRTSGLKGALHVTVVLPHVRVAHVVNSLTMEGGGVQTPAVPTQRPAKEPSFYILLTEAQARLLLESSALAGASWNPAQTSQLDPTDQCPSLALSADQQGVIDWSWVGL